MEACGKLFVILLIAGFFLLIGEWIGALACIGAFYGVLVVYNRLEGDGKPTFKYRDKGGR
jgi:hypothetical protein